MGRLDGRLANKVAVITGAASGIGEGTARRFAEEGAQLVIVDVSEYLVNNEMIRIQAKTDSFGSVDSIEAAILGNVHFKGAQKSNVNKARNGKMSFTVTIPRTGSEEEEEG